MINVTIKEEDKLVFAKERYEHPHPRVNQRMDVLHLKAKGYSNKDICYIADICHNTLLSYLKMYNTGGVDKLREIKFNRPKSEMKKYINLKSATKKLYSSGSLLWVSKSEIFCKFW